VLEETNKTFNYFFDSNEQVRVRSIIKELNKEEYCTNKLWDFDREIGGIGGYCLPINPVYCQFQGTDVRNIYRGYQYARARIDISNIQFFTRDLIRECGTQLEDLLQLYIKENVKFNIKKYLIKNKPLGSLIKILEDNEWISLEIINELKMMVSSYNKSKHEIDISDKRKRTFCVEDGIIYYLACRKIGIKILRSINLPLTQLVNEKFDVIYKDENWKEFNRTRKNGIILTW